LFANLLKDKATSGPRAKSIHHKQSAASRAVFSFDECSEARQPCSKKGHAREEQEQPQAPRGRRHEQMTGEPISHFSFFHLVIRSYLGGITHENKT
jgi:hypothetical protein